MADRVSEKQLLSELEQGKSEHVKGFFGGQFEEERIGAVDRMRTQYQQDVTAGRVAPGTLDFGVKQWFGENIDINYKGKNVYHDTFDIAGLKHSDPSDVVPENRVKLDLGKISQVTKDLEGGSPFSLASAVTGMYAEEQQRYLQSVVARNAIDRVTHSTDAQLLTYNGWNKNPQMVVGLERLLYDVKNVWSNPGTLYSMTVDNQTGSRTSNARPDKRL